MWHKSNHYKKGVGAVLALVLIVCMVLVSGTGPAGAAGESAASPGVNLVIATNPIDEASTSLELWGSGWTPGDMIWITFVGEWSFIRGEEPFPVTEPEIGADYANECGAFKLALNLTKIRRCYDLVPGVYTVKAQSLDGQMVATAPLVVAE